MTVNANTATICYELYNLMVFLGIGLLLGTSLTLLTISMLIGLRGGK